MSSLWTPSGERPIRQEPAAPQPQPQPEIRSQPGEEPPLSEEELRAQMAEVQRELAVDAMAAIVETLGSRLGEDQKALEEALTSVRLAFVQVQPQGAPPS